MRTLKNAVEDAHGVLAFFSGELVQKSSCLPEVLEAVRQLEVALHNALERGPRGRVLSGDRDEIQRCMQQLFVKWSECDERTQAMLLDLRTVFGHHLGMKFGPDGGTRETP